MALRMNLQTSREIFNVINAYNRKITRLSKTGGYITPQKVSFEDVVKNVNNKAELNRVLKALRLYNVRGMEKPITTKSGVTLSRYRYNLIKNNQRSAKRKVSRRLNKLSKIKPTTYGEKDSEYTYAQMGDPQIENLRARKRKLKTDIENLSKENLREYETYLENVNSIDYNYRDKIYMDNYLNDMIFNLGRGAGVSNETIEEIREKILNNMSNNEIINMMQGEEAIRSLSDWYPVIHRKGGLNLGNVKLIQAEFEELRKNIDKIINTYRA